MNKTLKIATRKSPLALWQAEHVKTRLETHHPDLNIELVKMTTQGDQILNSPLSKIGGKGLFIKELEVGMMEGVADIAVHSMKDMPYEIPQGFALGAILKRENPFDAFVSNHFDSIDDLPQYAKVGTCSMRRIVQLKAIRPDLEILDLRGNVNTRLKKLDGGSGQNAINQAKEFNKSIELSGISITKLDGTAKGGVLFAISDELKLPIRYIGIGEGIGDLKPFIAKDFVDALFD